MVSLRETISQKRIEATKTGNSLARDVFRSIETALSYELKRAGATETLSDEQVTKIIRREYKKREEAIEAARQAGRTDMAEKETAERDIIASIMPEQASDADIEAVALEVIEQKGAAGDMSKMGEVIGDVVGRFGGNADGKSVSQTVKRLLGGA